MLARRRCNFQAAKHAGDFFDPVLGVVIAESSSLSSDDLSQSHLEFTVSPGQPLLRVRLIYNRTLGTPRISGSLDVQSTQIQVIKKL